MIIFNFITLKLVLYAVFFSFSFIHFWLNFFNMMLFTDGTIDMTISQDEDNDVTEPLGDDHLTTAIQIESSKDQILDNGKDLFIFYVTQSHQPYMF